MNLLSIFWNWEDLLYLLSEIRTPDCLGSPQEAPDSSSFQLQVEDYTIGFFGSEAFEPELSYTISFLDLEM